MLLQEEEKNKQSVEIIFLRYYVHLKSQHKQFLYTGYVLHILHLQKAAMVCRLFQNYFVSVGKRISARFLIKSAARYLGRKLSPFWQNRLNVQAKNRLDFFGKINMIYE